MDHAGSGGALPGVRHAGGLPAGALDPPGVRPGAPGRPDVHDAGGDLRDAHRRLGHLHHPLHDLRGHSPVFERREVFHRLLVHGARRVARGRRADGRPLLLSSRGALGKRRRHDGDPGRGGLSPAGPRGVRERRRRRPPRGGRAGRHPLPAGPGRRGLPDRRVPQDLLSRRDPDGDHPHAPLLPLPLRDGGNRFPEARNRERGDPGLLGTVDADAPIRVPLHVPGGHRGVHAGRATPPSRPCSGPRSSPSS